MKKGVTLVELLVVVGMMAIITTIGALSLGYTQVSTQMSLTIVRAKDALEQSRARSLNGNQTSVYFEADRFTVFSGIVFTPSDPENEETVIDSDLSFSTINFPSGLVIFDPVTGYADNFAAPYNVILTDTKSGASKTISINELGVVEVM